MPKEQREDKMPKNKKCVVGYKTATMENGHIFGHRFAQLDACCDEFKQWFNSTGNAKVDNFNGIEGAPFNEKNGLNFVTRGGNLEIELRVTNPFKTGKVNYCHACGAEIEIKEVVVVTLKRKEKQVFDGYEECDIINK